MWVGYVFITRRGNVFMIISIKNPLYAGIIHTILCFVDSVGFAVGMAAISNAILKKTSLV